jgi:hypothetical protein
MANITSLLIASSGNSPRGRVPYFVENTIDLTANSYQLLQVGIQSKH